jgi:Holliday junction resolvasome RuvABC endonuclease subunit
VKILAIDPAALAGFCSPTASGTWNLKPKSYESNGMKFIKMRASIDEIVKAEGITFIAYEKPSGRHFNGIRSHANFEGVIVAYCEENGLDYKDFAAKEIKKFATGNGNAGKPLMMQACKDKYGVDPVDDNHADAVHIYHLAKTEFGL